MGEEEAEGEEVTALVRYSDVCLWRWEFATRVTIPGAIRATGLSMAEAAAAMRRLAEIMRRLPPIRLPWWRRVWLFLRIGEWVELM